jgi:hypothetical protein
MLQLHTLDSRAFFFVCEYICVCFLSSVDNSLPSCDPVKVSFMCHVLACGLISSSNPNDLISFQKYNLYQNK